MSVIKRAKSASNQLLLVSTIIFALSAVGMGAVILIALAVFRDEFLTSLMLISIAVAQLLVVWLFHSFASAVSAGLDLKVAQHQLSSIDVEQQPNLMGSADRSALKLSAAESRKIKKLSDDQLTEWILMDQPSLSVWDPTTSFDEWLRQSSQSLK